MTQADRSESTQASRLAIAAWLGGAILVGGGFAFVVTAIGDPPGRVEAGASPSTLASEATPVASPSDTGEPTALASATAPPSATPMPTAGGDLADLRLEFEDVDPTTTIGTLWDAQFAQSVARQLGVDVSSLRPRVIRTLTSDELPRRWTAVSVEYGGDSQTRAVGGYLAEALRRPGSRFGSSTINESERIFVVSDDWALAWSDELLLLMGFDVAPYLEATPEQRAGMPSPHLLITTVAERLLPPPGSRPPAPTATPVASRPPEATAPADASLAATLPGSILGAHQDVTSYAWLTDEHLNSLGSGLHPWLVGSLGRDASDASLAIGGGSVSTFGMFAHRLRDTSGEEMLAAYLGERFAGLMGGWEQVWEGREVDGRRYVVFNETQALYAQDDVLYWLLYFDFGDCFEDCDYDTRPPFDEIVADAISAIPGAAP